MTRSGGNWDTTVVPVRDFAFERLIDEKLYAYPTDSTKQIFDYMAFYRPAPVSAITHYGKIESVNEDDIDIKYRAICFGDRAHEDATVIRFEDIKKITDPVESSGYGVQDCLYTDLSTILTSSKTNELKK